MTTPRPATSAIVQQQAELLERLPFADTQDFVDAERGLLASIDEPVRDEDGRVLWDNSTALASGGLSADGLAAAGIELTGDATVLARLADVLDPGDKNFAIVTPD